MRKLVNSTSKIILLFSFLVYVEASDECNKLTFAFGTTGLGAPIANRAFSIKVTKTFLLRITLQGF